VERPSPYISLNPKKKKANDAGIGGGDPAWVKKGGGEGPLRVLLVLYKPSRRFGQRERGDGLRHRQEMVRSCTNLSKQKPKVKRKRVIEQ